MPMFSRKCITLVVFSSLNNGILSYLIIIYIVTMQMLCCINMQGTCCCHCFYISKCRFIFVVFSSPFFSFVILFYICWIVYISNLASSHTFLLVNKCKMLIFWPRCFKISREIQKRAQLSERWKKSKSQGL